MILPDKFGGKFENKRLNERLKIEAIYQASIHDQLNDIEQVELDELLLVPTNLDYRQ
jgi:tRNA U34 5-carboxymethylaminomethyl modifying enzyme MnmG/GidA